MVAGAWGWRMRIGGTGNGKRSAVRGGRGTRTWDGDGACGGAWGSRSGSGGGWGWGMCIAGVGNGKRGAIRGGMGTQTWDGGAGVVALGGAGTAGAGPWGFVAASKKKCFSNALGYTLVVLKVL